MSEATVVEMHALYGRDNYVVEISQTLRDDAYSGEGECVCF